MLYLMPGDPAVIILGPSATPETIEIMRKYLGLDQPLYVQYFSYMSSLLSGNFGRSIVTGGSALSLLTDRFLNTAELAIVSIVFSASAGIIAGTLSAMKQGSKFDNLIMGTTVLSNSTPVFVLGTILMYVFSIQLGILPAMGNRGWYSVILPALALSGWLIANIARVTRTQMIEILGQDYVRTMRAMGFDERTVILKYALRNAFVPVLTLIGMYFGYTLGGAVLTETVFAWPGVGRLIVDSIFYRDFVVIRGGILLVAVTFVFINLATDLLCYFIDPRIRHD
jgi:ABC-type dipeptide/oligopeptide/nickel transport system permease component